MRLIFFPPFTFDFFFKKSRVNSTNKKPSPMDSSAGAEGISFPAFRGILGRFSGFDGLFAAFNFFPAVYFHFFRGKSVDGGELRTEIRTEWAIRLGQGVSSSYFRQGPGFIEPPRSTAGCLERKSSCFRPHIECRRATKRPHTLTIAFPPLYASLFRVGGLGMARWCVPDAYLRDGK